MSYEKYLKQGIAFSDRIYQIDVTKSTEKMDHGNILSLFQLKDDSREETFAQVTKILTSYHCKYVHLENTFFFYTVDKDTYRSVYKELRDTISNFLLYHNRNQDGSLINHKNFGHRITDIKNALDIV